MPLPTSLVAPPAFFAHTKLPEVSNFVMKISSRPALVRGKDPAPGSKSTVPLKEPVV